MEPEEFDGEEPPKKKNPMIATAIAFVVISIVAVGLGWFLGTGFSERPAVPVEEEEVASVVVKKDKKSGKKDAHGKPIGEDGEDGEAAHGPAIVAMLDPIVTSLGEENGLWLRLELAVVFGEGQNFNGDLDKVTLQSDVIAYLRTIDPVMLSGASGFIHLQEDLVDRVRMSTEGRAVDVKILSLVAE